jgi:acetyl-CoA carboxylase biotin carboxyl carrier protein
MNPLHPEDLQDLKQLIEFLKENRVAEFEFDRGDLKVRLKFEAPEASVPSLSDVARLLASVEPSGSQGSTAQTVADAATSAEAQVAVPVEDLDAGLHIVKSPIVGTFFGSPSPGTAPFVSSGERVEKGQVVGIIEAMKLMNPIESDAAGVIVKCFVSNGQPIEYGQPLFSVRLG